MISMVTMVVCSAKVAGAAPGDVKQSVELATWDDSIEKPGRLGRLGRLEIATTSINNGVNWFMEFIDLWDMGLILHV